MRTKVTLATVLSGGMAAGLMAIWSMASGSHPRAATAFQEPPTHAATEAPPPAPADSVIALPVPVPGAAPGAKNDMSANDQVMLAQQLGSDDDSVRQGAIKRIGQLSDTDPRNLALGLGRWSDGLLAAKRYADVEKFALQAINERPFDVAVVESAQRARVLALMGEGNFSEGLKQAKAYYNVAALSETPEALEWLTQLLVKTGDSAAAAGFRAGQMGGGEGGNGCLATIVIDAEPYAAALSDLQNHGGGRNTNLVGAGNLLLLSDQAGQARRCFESACKNSGKNGKRLRESLEGVARARRAETGSIAAANEMINSVAENPEALAAELGMNKSAGDLQSAAQIIPLAQMQMTLTPPLELQRSQNEESGEENPPIQINSGFECATPITVKADSPTHFEIRMLGQSLACWFMFRLDHVNGQTVRLDIVHPNTDLNKWLSLNPVYLNSDQLANAGNFSSGIDPSPASAATTAWNGSQLPSTDKESWHYIPDAWNSSPGVFSFVRKFNAETVYVAMRVPCPPDYNATYLRGMASRAGVNLIEIGRSADDRPLQIVRISDPTETVGVRKPCVLLYSGEHGDEPDGAWAIHGLINFLVGDDPAAGELRRKFDFLAIPGIDPDATAASIHEGIIRTFLDQRETPESIAYMTWFKSWIGAGHRLDLVIDFHNLQSHEGPHVSCPLLDAPGGEGDRGALAMAANDMLMEGLRAAHFTVDPHPWTRGLAPDRLGGWLNARYGAFVLPYELNSQEKSRHLELGAIQFLGRVYASEIGRLLDSPLGVKLLSEVDRYRSTVKINQSNLPQGGELIH